MTTTFLLLTALLGAALGQDICKLKLRELDHSKEPLFLNVRLTGSRNENDAVEELQFIYPEMEDDQPVINVGNQKKLLVACTGKDNSNVATGKAESYLECEGGSFLIEGRLATPDLIACKSYAKSELKIERRKCGKDKSGTMMSVGFRLSDRSWFPTVDICHNIDKQFTIYTTHAIEGHSLLAVEKHGAHRNFKRGNPTLFSGNQLLQRFGREGQKAAFKYILGDAADEYLSDSSYLAVGHLIPDADFIYNIEQLMTYYYVNAAPQWQTFNAGNWLIAENAVRDLAHKDDSWVQVHTGTSGVLKLKDASGTLKPIYLDYENNRIPVPDVYWKIVQHPITDACTVVVGHNNVFLKEAPEFLCEPTNPDGWPVLSDATKGYVYYCHYKDFAEKVPNAPRIYCKDLFDFPI